MSKSYNESEKEEKVKIDAEVLKGASEIGSDGWDAPVSARSDFWKRVGMCKDCIYLHGMRTEFGFSIARCSLFECNLRYGDPVIECSKYEKRNMLSLDNMKDIAIIIETGKKEIGFIKNNR